MIRDVWAKEDASSSAMGMALGFGLSGGPAACVTCLTLWLAGEVRADVGVDELGGRVEYEVMIRQIPAPTASEAGDESGRRVTAAKQVSTYRSEPVIGMVRALSPSCLLAAKSLSEPSEASNAQSSDCDMVAARR